MRKLILFAAAILAAAIPVNAQESYPTNEIFAGYSFLRSDTALDKESLHGWGLSFSVNPSPRWGVVAEFGGHYGSARFLGDEFDISRTTFMFGPRVSARGKAASAFAHALLGGAKTTIEGASPGTKFAMALGGGADIKVSKRVAFRALQADYVPIRAGGEWLHNFRLQTGIVFRFGGG